MGVKTIGLTERKGGLAGALIVREHQELVFISQNGMVQRTGVKGISKQGRPAQGVRVMNLREDDVVSAVALVVETSTDTGGGGRGGARGGRAEEPEAEEPGLRAEDVSTRGVPLGTPLAIGCWTKPASSTATRGTTPGPLRRRCLGLDSAERRPAPI